MKKLNVKINTVEKVKIFVKIVSQFDCEVEVSSKENIVDGKSIIQIFSLDLSETLHVKIAGKDEKECEEQINSYGAILCS